MTHAMPVTRQVAQIRHRFPNTILLFRLGDFLEAYEDDAHVVAGILDTRINSRKTNDGSRRVDVTGFPFSAGEASISQLVAAGHRVAICDRVGSEHAA